jgi:nucleoside-diphosphate-sugar epimerase
MTKKVLVTGAAGTIGTIVQEDLASRYDLVPVDRRPLPDRDIRRVDLVSEFARLKELMAGVNAVIHLACVEETETTTENFIMAKNVCRAAMETTPHPRLIVASSIHAVGGHLDWESPPYCYIAGKQYDRLADGKVEKITDDAPVLPDGVYGASKVYVEALGELYASRGLEVVVIRFGGVRRNDEMADETGYHAVWLSRRDCAQIIGRAIDAELQNPFVRAFAVSDNKYRVHSLRNARDILGYEPEDDAENHVGC